MNQLIEKTGKSTVVDLLPSLFITIDTNNFKETEIMYDYQGLVPNTISIINDFAKHNLKDFTGTIYDVCPIVELINEITLPPNVDCIYVSYLGKHVVRMKNAKTNHGKSLYLDAHAVRIALTDMQTYQVVNRGFICTGALMLSFFMFFTPLIIKNN
jgi:hypothetical protein